MSWRLAESLKVLRNQVDTLYPGRRKESDGSIGDAAHSSRKSDHNPWVDGGVVTALDITHDPKNGCDCHFLAKKIVQDRRVKYVIWNREICSRVVQPGVWRPYNGSNPHTLHVHISVQPNRTEYDDQSHWDLSVGDIQKEVDEDDKMRARPLLFDGSRGQWVGYLQKKLNKVYWNEETKTRSKPALYVDWIYGPATQKAVIEWQEENGLTPDGVVGQYTWRRLEGCDVG